MNTQHNQLETIKSKKQKDTIYVQNTSVVNPIQLQQNLSQNGVQVKEKNSLLVVILSIIGLIVATIGGLGLLGGALEEKFNQVVEGAGLGANSFEGR